ncbi:MAG: pyridoxal phosphate-dependent aminotransferase [Candidatus Eisenbacteria bacterium]|nr:pyridoxal phosphate-dependent aminotransferase [Candidatus Eisenbacteria bacterium]
MNWPRLPSYPATNPLTRRRLELERDGRRLLDLVVSNPTRVGLPLPTNEVLAELAGCATRPYDPNPRGSEQARAAVAAYYADHGARVDPDRIILTASTSEAYAHAMRLLAAPGEVFLVPSPSYPLLAPLAALEGVTLRTYTLHYDDRWWLDRASFEEALATGDVRGVILVQPNNPTGSVFDADEMEFAARLAARVGATLVVDEVFLDFPAPDVVLPTMAGRNDWPLLVLSGLSKVAGLPQMKLGWMVIGGPPTEAVAMRRGLEWIADAFLSVGAPVQSALPGFLSGRHEFLAAARRRLNVNEAWLDRQLAGTAVTRRRRDGGWSVVLKLPARRRDDDWCLALLDAGVVAHPGHFYDTAEESLIVLSLLTPENEWADGLERLLGTVGPG